MKPTVRHLKEVGLEFIGSLHAQYEPYGRKPWRLVSRDGESLRGPKREKTTGYPDGLPGIPYVFDTAKQALEFGEACFDRLENIDGKESVTL